MTTEHRSVSDQVMQTLASLRLTMVVLILLALVVSGVFPQTMRVRPSNVDTAATWTWSMVYTLSSKRIMKGRFVPST